MGHEGYFRLLQAYSDLWTRAHCRVIIRGEEHLAPVSSPAERRAGSARNRVYLVSHPTTYDLPVLAHISKRNFHVVVAEGPFSHPIVGWLFPRAGFPMLRADNSEQAIQEALRLMGSGAPLIYSLKGYGVDFGERVRPRTGGIRIAAMAGADLYPVHLMIEPGKMLFRWYRDRNGGVFPYTIFWNTLYFVTFCEPIRCEQYAGEGMGYEEHRGIASRIDGVFSETQSRLEAELTREASRYRRMRRWGGASRRVPL